MELKELLNIFSRHRMSFLSVILFFVAGAFVWQQSRPVSYQATLLLNIGRAGVQATQDYTYDGFYRLQADERFADTVVRWLGSPRVVEDIFADAQMNAADFSMRSLKRTFKAGRLSSQMIEVSYGGRDRKALERLSQSAVSVLNRYTESLDREGKEPNRFVVIGSDPVIRDARPGLLVALAVGLAIGIFIGVWTVLIRHYFQPTKNSQQSRAFIP